MCHANSFVNIIIKCEDRLAIRSAIMAHFVHRLSKLIAALHDFACQSMAFLMSNGQAKLAVNATDRQTDRVSSLLTAHQHNRGHPVP